MRFAPGEQFRHLEIGEVIGRGAFATVFLAFDTLVDRTVALKVVRMDPSVSGAIKRQLIVREARLAGRLSSPHIVTVYHLYDLDTRGLVIEMEHVKGQTLGQLLRDVGALPLPESLRILRGVLGALQAAHDNAVVHRDIKPGNVLLGEDGAIKLTDFGLSQSLADNTLSISSMDGLVGTPQYVAPEVIKGGRSAAAADIWGAGVLAHRMLDGKLPFDGLTLPELFEQIQFGEPSPLGASVPEGLRDVLATCLAKAPEDRPRSCAHLLAKLEDVVPASNA
jgi:serine/threonine protein kinase